jgi:hypothetical protein
LRRKESLRKSSQLRLLVDVLSSTEMLHEEETTAKHLAGFKVDGEAGPVVVTASRTVVKSGRERDDVIMRGKQNGVGVLLRCPCSGIRPLTHVGRW